MKMKKVVSIACATLLAVTCAQTIPASAGTFVWDSKEAGTEPSPNPAVNEAGATFGTGTSNRTGSATDRNVYSSATASAAGNGAGGAASQDATVTVHENWKWKTDDPLNDPAPVANYVSHYSYDGSVVSAMAGATGTGSCYVSYQANHEQIIVLQAEANAAQNSFGPTTGSVSPQSTPGSIAPFDVSCNIDVFSSASAESRGDGDSGSATSGTNHLGISSFTVTP